jgi:hypothetical protein
MIDVRIICTYDALKLAETLTRLLEAEEHRVRLSVGRQSLSELETARCERDAVLVIWSPDARSQIYMLEWANKIDATRLVEISLADPPRVARKATVIDFSHWRGERGERAAWNALNDRLRGVDRALNPPKPPSKYAAFALGMASAAAVTGAVVLRMDENVAPATEQASAEESLEALDADTGLGGPLSTIEPASLDDYEVRFGAINVAQIRAHEHAALAPIPDAIEPDLRDATVMERISALNPLRRQPTTEN